MFDWRVLQTIFLFNFECSKREHEPRYRFIEKDLTTNVAQ